MQEPVNTTKSLLFSLAAIHFTLMNLNQIYIFFMNIRCRIKVWEGHPFKTFEHAALYRRVCELQVAETSLFLCCINTKQNYLQFGFALGAYRYS